MTHHQLGCFLTFTFSNPVIHHILSLLYPKYILNMSISFHHQGHYAHPNHHFILPFPLFSPMIYSPHSNQKDCLNVNHTKSLSCLEPFNRFPILSIASKVLWDGPGSVFLSSSHAILCTDPETWESQVRKALPSRPLYLPFHLSRMFFAALLAC